MMPDQLPYHIINGVIYPRVSTVVDMIREPGLEKWRQRVGDDVAWEQSAKAARLGTQIHKLIEADLKGLKLPWPKTPSQDLKNVWEAYRDYKGTFNPKPYMVEQQVHSEELHLAGHIDLGDLQPDALYITDFTLAGRIKRSKWLQTNSYIVLFKTWQRAVHEYRNGYAGPDIQELPIRSRIVRLCRNLGMYEEANKEFNLYDWNAVHHLARAWVNLHNTELFAAQETINVTSSR